MGRDAFRTAAFAAGAAWLAGCTALLGLDDKTFDGPGGAASTSSGGAGGAGGAGGGAGGSPGGGETAWVVVGSAEGGTAAIGGMVVDDGGSIWVAGDFSGTLTLGSCSPLVSQGDRSAFFAKLGPDGDCITAQAFGAGTDREVLARDIAVDPTGGAVLAGRFEGTVLLPSPAQDIMAEGSSDMFALKLDSRGIPAWSYSFGGPEYEAAESVAVDEEGHTYLATVIPAAVEQDVMVVKLTPEGAYSWSKTFGSSQADEGLAVVAIPAPSSGVAAAGIIAGDASFDDANLSTTGPNAFVVTLSPSNGYGASGIASSEAGPSAARALAFDPPSKALYVAGDFQDALKLESDPNAPPLQALALDDTNGFVARLDSKGTTTYAQLGQLAPTASPSPDRLRALALDPQSGDVVAAGAVHGEITFVDAQGAAAGGEDIVVARLDPALTHVRWMRVIGEQGGPDSDQSAVAVALDPTTGNTVVAGTFAGSVDFGDGTPREASAPALFILALEP